MTLDVGCCRSDTAFGRSGARYRAGSLGPRQPRNCVAAGNAVAPGIARLRVVLLFGGGTAGLRIAFGVSGRLRPGPVPDGLWLPIGSSCEPGSSGRIDSGTIGS